MDTGRMGRRRTGFAYLDAVFDHPRGVLAFAHRGGAFHPEIEGLENSLAAFQHAVNLGYRYLETDVHATRDGVLLAFHDAVLDRVTERRGAIVELDYAEVAEALIGGREQIPTLASLFERFPDARFNIDIKSEAAVEPLATLLDATAGHGRVCVASFSGARLRRFRQRVTRPVATAADPLEVALFRFLPVDRAVAVLDRGRSPVLQVPHRFRGLTVVTRSFVERAHALGRHVHVWTIDDPDEMHQLLDLGVDGLMTDRTDVLRAVLQERGQWMGATG